MKAHVLLTSTVPPLPPSPSPPLGSLPLASPPPPFLSFLRPNTSFLRHHRKSPSFQLVEAVRFNGPFIEEDCLLEVETVVIRTLPPAVTLERGLESIKKAVEELKTNVPPSHRGVLRFQVVVPPGPKALSWFCCQPASSGVFPRFFLSNEVEENPSFKSLLVNRKRGVFGIGVAVYFVCSCSAPPGEQSSTRRYLSSDSTLVTSYGFMNANFDMELSSFKHETGSFYFLIPELELNEHEDVSLLAGTLAWDETFSCTFEHAIQSFESSLHQAVCHFWPTTERCNFSYTYSALRKVDLVEDETIELVSVNALMLDRKEHQGDHMELTRTTPSSQFCFKLSPTVGFARNMLDHAQDRHDSLQECPNINAVWASLLVEECCRLGLTYFCIAPGSRSSPLAIAASAHPHATCVACFDERSLAFHAVGYTRGSLKPAIIVTTSGTAVSNLLPAVVEASQDLLPLLLLTADRPPELHDAGANQAINQVNHYGSFVRFFFSLPAPSDDIPARMVLTTLDSAVYWATSSPYGPVHINCPFREPLDDSQKTWMSSCLRGLEFWMSSIQPFTTYFQIKNWLVCKYQNCVQMIEVLKIIQDAERGLLLLGAIHTEDEIWATLLLAKHLNWPVVPDILSGLRLRRLLSSFPETLKSILFMDHLDHALLSASVRCLLQLDVIIQLGTRITSKRVSQMLQECCPCTYILVDNNPCRHDPSHLVTHRVECSIVQFADSLLNAQFFRKSIKWWSDLQAIENMVASDALFQVNADSSMTEPYVVHAASEALSAGIALFVGNSMAIRDANMYGHSWRNLTHGIADMVLCSDLPCLPLPVAGNRGASGIDGLLSTAVGFAVGYNKRVLCVLGDISFLHDTNGLAILNQRMLRKPMTIIVINNHGGAIFSFLPIADRTDPRVLNQYFYTSHSTSIQKLCQAHGVTHLQVKTKLELSDALLASQHENTDFVIEVDSCIDSNSNFHSTLRKSACQAANHALSILSRLSAPYSPSHSSFPCKIQKMEYSLYRIQLVAAPTLSSLCHDPCEFYKEGYILSLSLEDGSVGYGEVAPLNAHKENLLDVEQQLRFLHHVIEGTTVCVSLSLLNGSFTSWIWNNLGIPEQAIYPSVRCGLEMAILNAIAVREGSRFLNIIQLHPVKDDSYERSSSVKICALVDSGETPAEVAYIARSLVNEGFTAIKLKVARLPDPVQDAAVVKEVRKNIGMHIELRVDANRNWAYEDAIVFGSLVKDCNLQYIEEPVREEDDIIKYHEETGLPIALDETIDNIHRNTFSMLEKYTHPGIVAVVLKPTVIGGFERAALIARWAQQHGKLAVVSAAFESSLGLSSYILFSYYLDIQNAGVNVMNRGQGVAHGLGTYRWIKQDVTPISLGIYRDPCSGFVGASIANANRLLQNFHLNENVICRTFKGEQVHGYHMTLSTKDFSCSLKVREVGGGNKNNVVIFLHGFLGSGEDWIPIMKAISGYARCISIDLPGHGGSEVKINDGNEAIQEATLSVEKVANLLDRLILGITPGKATLVGYSMGARIALHMALRLSDKINGAVLVSGSPGLKDAMARKMRQAKDDSKAKSLVAHGLQCFLDGWYAGELWKSFRSHPRFKAIVASRVLQDDVHGLAKVLSELSIGGQLSLWEDLKQLNIPLLLVVGERDAKFKSIAREMWCEINRDRKGGDSMQDNIHELVEVPHSGHAVHLENPLPFIAALGRFLNRIRKSSVTADSAEVLF